ncbi:MAG: 2-oxoacid:acceptor oxidoreductase family protein [Crenarchaeota archaeon]|nr:2-oxoacid:acceptor oxidoreductase family protein [Thermoproteota archaeon]MCR8453528.1 2-oxoacid:acceptor oxidoreductase family protein [Thermoproteota archaeon]MCR8454829.1 2-oxoacid:acceptor oxidoreductase family protein [Thermoproteota archaeon]MCR8462720.1 2-oxoacid:acceptor oxidoreductase family protein [Thermoproteota archaeon]MCR8470340.1 2-oxoacid:acceptor oxidoreductase family protein [Thermoproteota archaeon]
MLIEVTWLGRGGQGVALASRLIVEALNFENKYAQSMIFFGAERRGAPVRAYSRISDTTIRYHHFVRRPDVFVVFSRELLSIERVFDEIKDGGTLIVNTPDLDAIRSYIPSDKRIKIGGVDANRISIDLNLKVAGLVVPNTVMLGAFSKIIGLPSLESLIKAIKHAWADNPKLADINSEAARRGFENAQMFT